MVYRVLAKSMGYIACSCFSGFWGARGEGVIGRGGGMRVCFLYLSLLGSSIQILAAIT